jgi:hypothetical protein
MFEDFVGNLVWSRGFNVLCLLACGGVAVLLEVVI